MKNATAEPLLPDRPRAVQSCWRPPRTRPVYGWYFSATVWARPNEESKVTRTVTAPVFAAVSSWSVVQFVVP
ncbi:hypothetical protein ACIG0C_24280 [Kitasatospora aureofaciens]|uniref:hypothetical protein n=1 Tax=Kitasatospora aureofaciens TaxID=1894 RepID=UPI00114D2423|nr:hypothetical protein [Kitasatospora aureofaciens]